jgi:hypothetical protein
MWCRTIKAWMNLRLTRDACMLDRPLQLKYGAILVHSWSIAMCTCISCHTAVDHVGHVRTHAWMLNHDLWTSCHGDRMSSNATTHAIILNVRILFLATCCTAFGLLNVSEVCCRFFLNTAIIITRSSMKRKLKWIRGLITFDTGDWQAADLPIYYNYSVAATLYVSGLRSDSKHRFQTET